MTKTDTTTTTTISFEQYARRVWGVDAASIVWPPVKGAPCEPRPIPLDAAITIARTPRGWIVTDAVGGWVADRIAPYMIGQGSYIGAREAARALNL